MRVGRSLSPSSNIKQLGQALKSCVMINGLLPQKPVTIVVGSTPADSTADITESELLTTLRELHPTRSLDWAERLVQIIQLWAGLLVEKRPKLFGFPHRTFQEYLAACHLSSQRDFVQQAQALAAKHQSWHEVILLAVGYLVHCAVGSARR